MEELKNIDKALMTKQSKFLVGNIGHACYYRAC